MNTLKTIILSLTSVFLINASLSDSLASFTDVSGDHVNKTAIEYLKENGVIGGYPDGTFKPDNTINRAEFLKIIIGMSGYNPDQDPSGYDIYSLTGLNFSDIESGAWYIPYLRKAVEDGIINGYPDGTFKPANEIKFVEAAKIIVNSFGFEVSEDKEIWYKPYVEELTENKRVSRTVNSFSKNITRGEMSEMVWRVKEDIRKNEDWISYKGLELAMQKVEKDPDDFTSLSQGN